MKLGPLLFAGLTVAGVAVGMLFAVQRGLRPVPGAVETQPDAAPQPIELITAKPLPPEVIPLQSPVSLESAFGRTEISGVPVEHVPTSPLLELNFDRRWDVALQLAPPRPAADLPPARASDEVVEPRADVNALGRDYPFHGLKGEARVAADQGLSRLRSGFAMLKEGESMYREEGERGTEGRRKLRQAADVLREAVDRFRTALRHAPNHSELLVLMRESKAALYHCMKHGM